MFTNNTDVIHFRLRYTVGNTICVYFLDFEMFGSSRGIPCDSVASCYIYDNLVRCHPILSILSRNIPHGIRNKQMYTAHHI